MSSANLTPPKQDTVGIENSSGKRVSIYDHGADATNALRVTDPELKQVMQALIAKMDELILELQILNS